MAVLADLYPGNKRDQLHEHYGNTVQSVACWIGYYVSVYTNSRVEHAIIILVVARSR